MPRHYEFDRSTFSFRKVTRTAGSVFLTVLKYFLVTASLAVVYYVIFALFVSTDTERRLRRENKIYEKVYPQMLEREALVSDAITNLQVKDNEIYRAIFGTEAPRSNPMGGAGFLAGNDSVPSRRIEEYTDAKSGALLQRTAAVEEALLRVFAQARDGLPPLSLPLADVSYAQVGASLGSKVNPFYKVPSQHNGLDLIANQGDPVFAAADGQITAVVSSRKGQGNYVEITHAGGYVTRYAHLSDIPVIKGQTIRRGMRIGAVGTTGNTFAAHLHYEILKDGRYVDPINYFFASVTPEEYMNMLFMSVTTGQSMD
jgi:murein DD-endopeptidase MepM/ murein hydrolase activator NlpD